MPPRASVGVMNTVFDLSSLLRSLPVNSRSQALTKCSACLFSTTAPRPSIPRKKVRRHIDPYRLAQARQRKAANLSRQQVLRQERKEALGDPVRSRPTPFIESLKSSTSAESSNDTHLNFFVKEESLQSSLEHSRWLTEPMSNSNDPQAIEHDRKAHKYNHENATKALAAITALENGSSKDRTRVNVQRCIEEFGRHKTDNVLPPKPASIQTAQSKVTEGEIPVPKRAGPDTGSSEVQVAILTAKINVLADNLGKKDKHNKRNLRLLVHRRQKLLKYLREKERGGPRWQNLMDKLGLGEATWKGEISL